MLTLLTECKTQHCLPTQLEEPLVWGMDPEFLKQLIQSWRGLVTLQSDALDTLYAFSQQPSLVKPKIFELMAQEVSNLFLKKYPVEALDPKYWFTRLTPSTKYKARKTRKRLHMETVIQRLKSSSSPSLKKSRIK